MNDRGKQSQEQWRPRVGTTPLLDLLRGRVTGRLDVEGRLSAYSLPAEVVLQSKRIARQTRLSKSERADVAVSLGEDAAIELQRGAEVASVLSAMGSPRARAREIRNERLAAKPLILRLTRGWKRRAVIGLAALVAMYGALLIWHASAKPAIKRNMSKELNAPLAKIAEAERAAPKYKQAVLAHPGVPGSLKTDFAELSPNDYRWKQTAEYVAASRASVDLARQAAALPHLGAEMGDGVDGELVMEPTLRDVSNNKMSTENPFALEMTFPYLGVFRGLTRLLIADARLAAEEGRRVDVEADIHAVMGIAGHARECPTLISDLVSIAVVAMAADAILDVIKDHPGLLEDAQLERISMCFRNFAESGVVPLRVSGETMFIEDFLQRSYTDDGNGDGRPCLEGIRNLRRAQGNSGVLSVTDWLVMPFTLRSWAGRKETLDKWQELAQSAQQTAAMPPWKRGEPAYEREFDRLDSDPRLSSRFWVINIMAPAYTKMIASIDQISLTRDGVVVAIALERWRLARGTWPDSLDQLVPEFLPAPPVDRMSGRTLNYRVVESRPLLYSTGPDADDDGSRELEGKNRFRAAHWRPPSRADGIPDADFVLFPRPRPAPKIAPPEEEEGG